MLLGKRPRPPMKRTTSMTEITFDLSCSNDEPQPLDPHNPFKTTVVGQRRQGSSGLRGNSADFIETYSNNNTSHFLRACFLCKRRLVPSRDIYMYR